MIKVSDFIAKYLRENYGLNNVFMVSGGGAMHLNASFGKYFNYICNHHEQACAIAAEGYARVNQVLAVVNVTTGPGGLNCLNGVFGQWTDSVPVLYISGQVKYSTTIASCPDLKLRQLGDQEVDIISCIKPLTKYAKMVTDPTEIQYHIDKAVYLATHGRKGPVWLDIPMNVQAALIDETKLKKYDFNEDKIQFKDYSEKLEILKKLLESSERPLIVAGHGIRLSGAKDKINPLIEKFKIPVVTTMNGFDLIPASNPYFVGRIGTVANRAGNFALQNADLVITIGSRNNIRQVSYNWKNYAYNAKLVVVDIDENELKKPTVSPELTICADAGEFIDNFMQFDVSKGYSKWNSYCKNIRQKYPFVSEAPREENLPIEPYKFIHKLIDKFSQNEVVVCGNGTAFLLPFQVGNVKLGQRYIWNSGDASMGYDLPAAIGACFANNKEQVICLAGDGSIMMNLQELQVIKHYNLPIKIFVLNNNGYISIRQTQGKFFDGNFTGCSQDSGVSLPDFIKVGHAFGLKTVRISSIEDVAKKLDEVLADKNAVLCEVMLNKDYSFAPKLSAKTLPDGTMVSPSLENMFPFLPEDELKSNMLN